MHARLLPLKNATRKTPPLPLPLSLPPTKSPDGRNKYFVSGNSTARIVRPDHGGRPLVPAVAYAVDSFLLPLEWKL
jgi:hypothetical protein